MSWPVATAREVLFGWLLLSRDLALALCFRQSYTGEQGGVSVPLLPTDQGWVRWWRQQLGERLWAQTSSCRLPAGAEFRARLE